MTIEEAYRKGQHDKLVYAGTYATKEACEAVDRFSSHVCIPIGDKLR